MIKLDDFPKGKEKLMAFTKDLLLAFQKELTKDSPSGVDLPVIEDELKEIYVNNILLNNKRSLYDFFDKEDIHLLVDYADGFYWQIKYRKNNITKVQITEPPIKHGDRISCEDEGFDNCFKILENG